MPCRSGGGDALRLNRLRNRRRAAHRWRDPGCCAHATDRAATPPRAGEGHESLARIECHGKRSSFGRSGRYGRVTVCRVVVPVIHLAYPPGLMVADDGLKNKSPILTTTESPAPAVTTIVPVMLLWWRQR